MNDQVARKREAELETMLTDANRQLLERDQEVFEILGVRDQELVRAHAELTRHARDIESLNRALVEMRATRAWQLAEQYRRFRERIKTVLPVRARER